MNYIESNSTNWAGIGHQFVMWSFGFLLSKIYNLTFIYTPFTVTNRKYNSTNNWSFTIDKNPKIKWDDYLNFKDKLHTKRPLDHKLINLPKIDLLHTKHINDLKDLKNINDRLSTWENLFRNNDKVIFKLPIDNFSSYHFSLLFNYKQYFYDCYWKEKTTYNFKNNKKNIVIHIRLGDITPEKYPGKYIDLKFYIDLIKKLKIKYSDHIVNIVSDGTLNQLKLLLSENVELHLDKNEFESFHMLCSADILITSKSSFSFIPCLLNNNIKYFYPHFNYFYELDKFENFYNILEF